MSRMTSLICVPARKQHFFLSLFLSTDVNRIVSQSGPVKQIQHSALPRLDSLLDHDEDDVSNGLM